MTNFISVLLNKLLVVMTSVTFVNLRLYVGKMGPFSDPIFSIMMKNEMNVANVKLLSKIFHLAFQIRILIHMFFGT